MCTVMIATPEVKKMSIKDLQEYMHVDCKFGVDILSYDLPNTATTDLSPELFSKVLEGIQKEVAETYEDMPRIIFVESSMQSSYYQNINLIARDSVLYVLHIRYADLYTDKTKSAIRLVYGNQDRLDSLLHYITYEIHSDIPVLSLKKKFIHKNNWLSRFPEIENIYQSKGKGKTIALKIRPSTYNTYIGDILLP